MINYNGYVYDTRPTPPEFKFGYSDKDNIVFQVTEDTTPADIGYCWKAVNSASYEYMAVINHRFVNSDINDVFTGTEEDCMRWMLDTHTAWLNEQFEKAFS